MTTQAEPETIGRVLVSAKIDNLGDLYEVARGQRHADDVRSIEVENALVDTGATLLHLPKRLIDELGLMQFGRKGARTPKGVAEFVVYGTVQLTVQGRDCRVDVAEAVDDCPVLIGQVPLELMDFVVDPKGRRLIGNPDHGGEFMIDVL